MAPLSSGIAAAMLETRIESRGVGGMHGNHTSTSAGFSPVEENSLEILALVFSVISVASSILAFYWFIKMRRSFRHE
jgi:G protein-coupled receptor GPR1